MRIDRMSEILLQQYGIFLIGAGLSLALLLLVFLLMRRNALKKRGLRPAALAIAEADDEVLVPPQVDVPIEDNPMKEAGGFQFFKRSKVKKSKTAPSVATTRLVDIEQEMLAIRELFRTGQISRSVYVAETKALYETARLVEK